MAILVHLVGKQVYLLEALKPAQPLMFDSSDALIVILVAGAYADNAVVAGMHGGYTVSKKLQKWHLGRIFYFYFLSEARDRPIRSIDCMGCTVARHGDSFSQGAAIEQ